MAGNVGIWGRGVDGVGLGLGRQQVHFLPEAHTDFIYPVIGEELGLICTFIILLLFLFLFIGSYWRLRSALEFSSTNWHWERFYLFLCKLSLIWEWSPVCFQPKGCHFLLLVTEGPTSWSPSFFLDGLLMFLESGIVHRECILGNYEENCHCMRRNRRAPYPGNCTGSKP